MTNPEAPEASLCFPNLFPISLSHHFFASLDPSWSLTLRTVQLTPGEEAT